MKPTIGRTVIYKYGDWEKNAAYNNGADECPAVIVRVWTDSCVNLKLVQDGPFDYWKTSASLGDLPGNWHWPEIKETK